MSDEHDYHRAMILLREVLGMLKEDPGKSGEYTMYIPEDIRSSWWDQYIDLATQDTAYKDSAPSSPGKDTAIQLKDQEPEEERVDWSRVEWACRALQTGLEANYPNPREQDRTLRALAGALIRELEPLHLESGYTALYGPDIPWGIDCMHCGTPENVCSVARPLRGACCGPCSVSDTHNTVQGGRP